MDIFFMFLLSLFERCSNGDYSIVQLRFSLSATWVTIQAYAKAGKFLTFQFVVAHATAAKSYAEKIAVFETNQSPTLPINLKAVNPFVVTF
jgi:hypothetical protein